MEPASTSTSTSTSTNSTTSTTSTSQSTPTMTSTVSPITTPNGTPKQRYKKRHSKSAQHKRYMSSSSSSSSSPLTASPSPSFRAHHAHHRGSRSSQPPLHSLASYLPPSFHSQSKSPNLSSSSSPMSSPELTPSLSPSLSPSLGPLSPHQYDDFPYIYVDTVPECARVCHSLRSCRSLVVDCEGVNLGRSGKLCLIQIASPHAVYLFDIVAGKEEMFDKGGLRSLLECRHSRTSSQSHSALPFPVLVMHDCRQDSDNLYHQYRVRLKNVFDTQVAFSVLSQSKGYGDAFPIGLNSLLKKYVGKTNQYKEEVRLAMAENTSIWEERPLKESYIQYAAQDVCFLYEAFHKMVSQLRRANLLSAVMEGSCGYVEQYRDHPEGSAFFQRQWSQRLDERRQHAEEERQKRFDEWKREQIQTAVIETTEKVIIETHVPSPTNNHSSDDEMSSGSSTESSVSVSCVSSPMHATPSDTSSDEETTESEKVMIETPAKITTSSIMFSPCFGNEATYSPSLSPCLAAALHPSSDLLSPAFSSYSPDITASPFATAPIPFSLPECLSPSASSPSTPDMPTYSISILQHITGDHGDDMPVFRRGKISPPKKPSSRTRTSVHANTSTTPTTTATTTTTTATATATASPIVYQDVPTLFTAASPLVKATSPPTTATRLRYRVKAKRTISSTSSATPSTESSPVAASKCISSPSSTSTDSISSPSKHLPLRTSSILELKQPLENKDANDHEPPIFAFATMEILDEMNRNLENNA